MNLYKHSDWVQFRKAVIELDGDKCVRCSRARSDGAILQVHHKAYIKGRKPWEYGYDECETLCKGCHAEEHGKVMPRSGWELFGYDDLGDLCGACEFCGTELRYIYLISHEKWTILEVGTDCCDKLTATADASNFLNAQVRTSERRKRFASSTRWQRPRSSEWTISQKGIDVCISFRDGKYQISMDGTIGRMQYETLLEAKIKVFDSIESGEAAKYLEKRRKRHQREN